jgi:hypothetical protein
MGKQSIALSSMIPTTKQEAEKFPEGHYLVRFRSAEDSELRLGVLDAHENFARIGMYFIFDVHSVEFYLPIEA